MGGQGMERREILRYIAIASVAASFPGFRQWAFACAHDPAAATAAASGSYTPLFFSAQHYRMIEHLAEMIIPEDETPGARQAGVAEFIDFMVANGVPVSTSREIRSTQNAIEEGNRAQSRFLTGFQACSQLRDLHHRGSQRDQKKLARNIHWRAKSMTRLW